MNGADWLIRELQRHGLPFLPVLCGNGLNPILEAAKRAGLPLIDARNEQAVSYMADTYARLTGRLGACAVSTGIAHVNAMAGLLNAHFDGAPLLLITGSSPSDALGRGAFQDVDQVELARPICKRAELASRVDRLPQALAEALHTATSGRPGPVHLTIPIDVLEAEIDTPGAARWATRVSADAPSPFCPPDRIRQTASLLAEARRPLIVAGSELFYAHAGDALMRFARLAHIPIVTPIWDRGVVDRPCEVFMGVIGAASGEPDLLPQADLILLAGARVDYRVRYLDAPPLCQDARIVRLTGDPVEMYQGVVPHLGLLADPRQCLQALADVWAGESYAPHDSWLGEAHDMCQRFYARWVRPPATNGTGWHLVEALRPLLDEKVIFLIDGGNIGQWVHMRLCQDRYPSHWLTCGASAVVGWGVPGAMAARLAHPKRRVLLLSGDGSIGFGLVEFESAARQGIPFVAIVADDSAWGIVLSGQEKRIGEGIASELGAVDYAQVARALGAYGVRLDNLADLPRAVQDGWSRDKPTLIQVPIARGGPADI